MLRVGRVNFSFAAAHLLPNHKGLCKNLHGHNYKLEVEFTGLVDSKTGMIVDFAIIKKAVNDDIIKPLDHTNLNERELYIRGHKFPNENPTAENMVLWMVDVLRSAPLTISRIRLWETDNSYIEWTS